MESRQSSVQKVRNQATEIADYRTHLNHRSNGEEQRHRRLGSKDPSYIGNFTKGLPHNKQTGLLINSSDYQ